MPNIKISDLETIAPGFDPDLVFVELQTTVAGELVSRKATASELTAGASPLNADYVTVTPNAILPNERILTGTAQVSVTDGGAGAAITLDIPINAIDNTFLADMAQATVKGRADGAGTGDPVDLTPAQLNAILASGGFATYFSLSATDRVIGSNAGTSQTGDNVFLANALAGDNNIADNIIAIGPSALAAAVQLDFAGSIAIGANAGALIDDTRDPWLIIGSNACAVIPGAAFHDGNTVIGNNALLNSAQNNMQGNTVIGFDACRDMDGAVGVIGSSVVIGFDAGRGTTDGTITSSVLIGRAAGGDLRAGGVTSTVAIGQNAGESMGGANLNVLIGANCTINATNIDTSIVIGCNTFAFSGTTENQLIIGHSSVSGIVTGETNILIGNSLGITGTQRDFDHCIIIGHLSGIDLIDDQNIFAIEQPQGTSSTVARPFLFGNLLEGNLALLNIAAMTGGAETGTRIVPAWADAAPTAGQGVFSMYGAGTDLAATTDADFVHFYVASADSTLTLRYPGGGDVTLLHDGTDAVIQTNIIVGPVADGKLFINTTTGVGFQGGSVISATPDKVSIYAARSATAGVDGGAVEIWGGYAAGASPAEGGRVGIWGGGGGGGAATGGNVELFGGDAEAAPGDVTLIGGTATVQGVGGTIRIDGGPGFGGNSPGGNVQIVGGTAVGTGIGGDSRINGGGSGPGATGNGGAVRISGGAVNSTDGVGGQIVLLSGDGNGTGTGGPISITGGIDSSPNGTGGGPITITAGDGRSGSAGPGGALSLASGDGAGTGVGGVASLAAGSGGFNSDGGQLNLDAGDSGSNDGGNGGAIVITSGAALGTNGDGGDINLTPALGNGSGVDGQIIIPQQNVPTLPTLAFGDGDSGFFESGDDAIGITLGGTHHWSFNFATFLGQNGVNFVDSAPTATAPNIRPGNADNNTGIGSAAADQLSLIAGGIEMLRLVESTVDQVIIGPAGVIGTAALPSLAWGDGDTGFFESIDDTLQFTSVGVARFAMSVNGILAIDADSFGLFDEAATATNPTLVPSRQDDDTGIGSNAIDQLSLIAGGVEGLRLAELNSGVLQVPSAAVTITAFAGGGQGSATALIHSYNVITVVGTDGDSVRLPSVFAVNSIIYIKNNDSAQAADVFPASGDNLGAGVDTAVSLLAGESLTFIATVADSTWTPLIVATGGGGAGADSDGARRSVGVPNATGSYIDYTELTVDPPSTGFYTVDITFGWSGNDANITGLDLNWTIGSGATPQSQGTWITTANTAPGGVESTTVDGGSLSGGVMPVASGTVSYVSQFHGIWDVGATLPTDIQLQFRRQGSSGTITGSPNASISIRKFAEL